MELIICIKMDLALKTYKGWYAIKPKQPTNQSNQTINVFGCSSSIMAKFEPVKYKFLN